VLFLVPAGTKPELDATLAHGVNLRSGDRERTWVPEGSSREQRPESDSRGLPCEAGERDPRVGRSDSRRRPVAVAHSEIVIGPEETVETSGLGGLRDC